MKTIFYVLQITFLCISLEVVAQQNKITGYVYDNETNRPLSNANVYLDQTTSKTSTNSEGIFTLNNKNNGLANLIISFVGYKTQNIPISLPFNSDLKIKLKRESVLIDEIVINIYDKLGWEKYGKIFVNNFIGCSEFSKQTKILNPEVLRFNYDSLTHILTVKSIDLLKIKNDALGYDITYDLQTYQYNTNTTILQFNGFIYFKEYLNYDRKIIKNRSYSYSASIQKFLKNIYNNTLVKEEYVVGLLGRVENTEQQLAEEKLSKIQNIIQKDYNGDSLSYFKDNHKVSVKDFKKLKTTSLQPKYFNKIISLLSEDKIIYKNQDEQVILPPNPAGKIIFGSKKFYIDKNYLTTTDGKNETALSAITFVNNKPVIINQYGQYFPKNELIFSDYLGWFDKIGNMLPYDYIP